MALSLDFHRAVVTTEQITEWNLWKVHLSVSNKDENAADCHNWRPLHLLWVPMITAELVPAVVLKHPNSVPDINNDVTEEWRNGKQSKC